jgi:hypothetical protein
MDRRTSMRINRQNSIGDSRNPSLASGPASEAMTKHAKALEEFAGCPAYCGNTEQDWFDSVFLCLQRHIQERHLLSAIYEVKYLMRSLYGDCRAAAC